ncbi:hypothetical protein VOLCADRAFT_99594 [Volvox carteri f. nagariensis]|uniref:Uncharacterized protein n=1 Tax=Volvox carteri f. nagariensis TaxID=3068 RepID=D8UI51_VOLCA|nr:uncharacterized protein VOLCADRAFT_99594 [Volvox carteri f. nagariensis]EFJ40614.1 hypothetical protein VOLCADRAFT_99594 [Volvox carteri f. nagariensis]|eukprot:XP_002958321.1 hypothetical protein VOLCADRAFT_99594 [Volvox carteri f. nagariensis]
MNDAKTGKLSMLEGLGWAGGGKPRQAYRAFMAPRTKASNRKGSVEKRGDPRDSYGQRKLQAVKQLPKKRLSLFRLYGSPGLREYLVHHSEVSAAAVDAIVTELLKLGAALKPQERFLLTAAAGAGDTLVVRTLLRAGVNAGSCGGRALVAASAAGHVAVMEVLLRAGVSARAENGMPLRAACHEGRVAAARLLLRHGADPRAAASGALAEAARGGHLELVLELLAAGADPRVDGSRALVEASAAGHGCVVLALLVAGAQPHARNGLALRHAEAGGHELVARVLRAAGRPVDPDSGSGPGLGSAGASSSSGTSKGGKSGAVATAPAATWRLASPSAVRPGFVTAHHHHYHHHHDHHHHLHNYQDQIGQQHAVQSARCPQPSPRSSQQPPQQQQRPQQQHHKAVQQQQPARGQLGDPNCHDAADNCGLDYTGQGADAGALGSLPERGSEAAHKPAAAQSVEGGAFSRVAEGAGVTTAAVLTPQQSPA